MRVRMRRRYRGGTRLNKREFVDQEWARGMLQLDTVEGRSRLGLWIARPGDAYPPLGILWRPELVTCYNDTISFAGAEHISGRWCYQVWFCEIDRGGGIAAMEPVQLAAAVQEANEPLPAEATIDN